MASIVLIAHVSSAYETVQDAAILARELVDSSPTSIGTMATIYPSDHPDLAGQPFPLQEYYASCLGNGSLTLLFLPISRHSQNILRSPGQSASISIWSEQPAASHARVALMGNVTIFHDGFVVPEAACYVEKHPDSRRWVPGDDAPHIAYWARFDPHSIYYVGGFGDEHYIGYIPLDLYQQAGNLKHGVAGRFKVQK
ncbi:hypothetical protein PLICRDRAFT_37701 [Plicaturopsis crispa FD-325 SS-3]|nr:hypothetical protein PLICRDRAFT_37701 [Plicaturopsis crispa FD-325 SS-3]